MPTHIADNKNIYLMGFMGCGKTSAGSLLARKMQKPFLDTDRIIEEKTGLSIPDIFQQQGESRFRLHEKEVIAEITQLNDHIIALGGGTVVSGDNWNRIVSSGYTVTLSFPPHIIYSRLRKDHKRPLLKNMGMQRLKTIKDLMEFRQPFYRKADLYLHFNSSVEPDIIVEKILAHLLRKKDHRKIEKNKCKTQT